jgi:hypothetical protein
MAAREPCNLPRRAPDAAPHVEDPHPLPDVHHVREVVLVADEALSEGLSGRGAVEVEALAEAELVEVGCEVVVSGYRARV